MRSNQHLPRWNSRPIQRTFHTAKVMTGVAGFLLGSWNDLDHKSVRFLGANRPFSDGNGAKSRYWLQKVIIWQLTFGAKSRSRRSKRRFCYTSHTFLSGKYENNPFSPWEAIRNLYGSELSGVSPGTKLGETCPMLCLEMISAITNGHHFWAPKKIFSSDLDGLEKYFWSAVSPFSKAV